MSRKDVAARRARAIALISSGQIRAQGDLVKALKKSGFEVTQATASRDLVEIGAIRIRNADGELVYAIGSEDAQALAQSLPLPAELIISVEHSGNIAVVKTPPGGAQLLASALDNGGFKGVIGTIAGDDTVLVVGKYPNGGAHLAKEFLSLKNPKKKVGK